MSSSTAVPTEDLSACTLAKPSRQPWPDAPETYFDTLMGGVMAWWNHLVYVAERKGLGHPDWDFLADNETHWQPMYADQTQRMIMPLVEGKKKNKSIHISVYKRDEGQKVYEVTAYIA